MSEIPRQGGRFFKVDSEDNLRAERMRQVGKERSKAAIYNVLEEHSYSRPLVESILNETSVGESITIDPEVCFDWRKGRRVVELSVLADKMFCVMCQTRLHLCDTINETKHGLGSILKIKCTNSVCNATNSIPTGTRDDKGAFEIHWKVVIGKNLLAYSAYTWFYLCHSLHMYIVHVGD